MSTIAKRKCSDSKAVITTVAVIITFRKLTVMMLFEQKPSTKQQIVSAIVKVPIELEKPRSVSTPQITPNTIAGISDSKTDIVRAKATKIQGVAPKICGNSDGVEPKMKNTSISRLYARYLKNRIFFITVYLSRF